ncbi:hypothetical protein CCR75_001271 [Bremia lactucae]|uniref:Uncharacterized protein n=1 Tax=Bremia lactucae TaxID=4779 RepID=A0A976IHS5_BRELC|nr:hypothetical protein CCR75_001271 [Bremia lactucae]
MASNLVWDARFHQYEALLTFSWFMTLSVGLLLLGYFLFHLWLLRIGKTTLEFLAGDEGEFMDIAFMQNVKVYFGQDVWTWWLPTTPKLDTAVMAGNRLRNDDDIEDTLQLVVK